MRKNLQKINQGLFFLALMTASLLANAQCPTPTSVTATPSIICAGTTASLNATAIGASINWYTVPVGGSILGTCLSGANFTVGPVITTTYYAESSGGSTSTTISTIGFAQNFTVPAGVTTLSVDLRGARGGSSYWNLGLHSAGGNGGRVTGTISVTPGQVLQINVGGIGGDGFNGGGQAPGGYNGGGIGGVQTNTAKGGGGGGSSDIRISPYNLSSRVAVAGGGGGGGRYNASINAERGGPGGLTTGSAGYNGGVLNGSFAPGKGGTQAGGGVGGTSIGGFPAGFNGALLNGGGAIGTNQTGGGGGGGYYGGGSGSMSGGGGGSSYLPNGIHTQGFQNGNGQVILSYASCVSISRTPVVVTVAPNPTITVNSGSICTGNSFTMSPSGAASYTYQGGNAVVSPTANTNYTVIGTSSLGCNSTPVTSSVTINTSPLPTVAVNSGSICAGSSFTMVPSGANTYTFQGGNAVVSPTANATYTVVGTNSVGCVSATFATSSISVTAAPSVSVSGTPSICVGQSATLTASGANTYSWNTGASTSSVVVNPTITTSYTITGTSSVTGCSGTTTISLLVSPCTSINENAGVFTGLNLYPNPNTGIFNIELPVSAELIIQNSVGELIYTENLNAGNAAINIQGLSNGLYFIQLKNKDSKATYKIIKQ